MTEEDGANKCMKIVLNETNQRVTKREMKLIDEVLEDVLVLGSCGLGRLA